MVLLFLLLFLLLKKWKTKFENIMVVLVSLSNNLLISLCLWKNLRLVFWIRFFCFRNSHNQNTSTGEIPFFLAYPCNTLNPYYNRNIIYLYYIRLITRSIQEIYWNICRFNQRCFGLGIIWKKWYKYR